MLHHAAVCRREVGVLVVARHDYYYCPCHVVFGLRVKVKKQMRGGLHSSAGSMDASSSSTHCSVRTVDTQRQHRLMSAGVAAAVGNSWHVRASRRRTVDGNNAVQYGAQYNNHRICSTTDNRVNSSRQTLR